MVEKAAFWFVPYLLIAGCTISTTDSDYDCHLALYPVPTEEFGRAYSGASSIFSPLFLFTTNDLARVGIYVEKGGNGNTNVARESDRDANYDVDSVPLCVPLHEGVLGPVSAQGVQKFNSDKNSYPEILVVTILESQQKVVLAYASITGHGLETRLDFLSILQ